MAAFCTFRVVLSEMLLRKGVVFGNKFTSRRSSRVVRPVFIPPLRVTRKRDAVRDSPSRRHVTRSKRIPPRIQSTAACPASLSTPRSTPQTQETTRNAFQLALRLAGVACGAVALFNCLGCASLGRFACVAADGAQKGMASMPAWTGLSAGFLHTLAGPDHLAGLAPLTLGQKQAAAVSMGALWGFGHSSGQLLLGIAFLVLKERFQGIVPFLSKWAGTVVGITLIAIGVIGIYESRSGHHDHSHPEMASTVKGGSAVKSSLGTYAIGFVYGLQPDALFVVLPALALPTRLATLSYVVMFVIGTVCAMAGYTLAIGTASEAAIERQPWLLQHLSTFAASVAIGIGFLILLASLGCQLPFSL